jgi:hypothetical protein
LTFESHQKPSAHSVQAWLGSVTRTILINYLNAMWGHQVVDNIGREVPDYIPPADGHRLPYPSTRFGSNLRPPPRIPVAEESPPKRRLKK